MNITIVGSGNAGCAHACMFTEFGHSVNLLKTSYSMHDDNFKRIEKNGFIEYFSKNREKKVAELSMISRDFKKSLKKADVVFIMTQTLQHKRVADLVMEHLDIDTTKMIVVVPGYLGSLYFNKLLRKNDSLIIAEGESTPFDARIIDPGVVEILFKNVRNALGFYPSVKSDIGLSLAKDIIDTYNYKRTNVIESAMHNPNLIVHTIGAIMSASRIEKSGGDFWMYKEAFSPSMWNLIHQLDEEKNFVISSFGGITSSYLNECKFRNELNLNQDPYKVFEMYAEEGGPKGPESLDTRFIYEDVPMGLCLLESLSNKLGKETPVASSLINIASCLLNKDFRAIARNLECLGLSEITLEELKEKL
ncbi:2-dehydropantoate 2-reductase (modular protein) [Vibrio chagasii]|nr:2-dehydropantoate 2-reductase (modular protein) [Vibrio chagasii]